MQSDVFINLLDDFQNTAVNELLRYKNKLVFVKGKKFIGKTNIAKKLYNKIDDDIVIYHTGCAPRFYADAYNSFKENCIFKTYISTYLYI